MRFRYVCVFVLIHFQERFQIDAFSMKTLSVLVWTEGLNAYKYVRFQTKPLRVRLVWTGPYSFFSRSLTSSNSRTGLSGYDNRVRFG